MIKALLIIATHFTMGAQATTATITPSRGLTQFEERGSLTPMGTETIIALSFDISHLKTTLSRMRDLAGTYKPIIKHPTELEIDHTEARVDLLYQLFADNSNRREAKDLSGWLAGFLGLYNAASMHDVQTRVDHTEEAIRLTVHQVDATKDFATKNADNIDRLKQIIQDEYTLLNTLSFISDVSVEWTKITDHVTAVEDVVAAALHHSLGPPISRIIDMPTLWTTMTQKIETGKPRHDGRLLAAPLPGARRPHGDARDDPHPHQGAGHAQERRAHAALQVDTETTPL